jgi:hypothetical protein
MSLVALLNHLQPGALLAGFLICNTDDENDVKYFGNMSLNGAWYIIRQTESAQKFSYTFGASGYSVAWTGRSGLTYTYPDGTSL